MATQKLPSYEAGTVLRLANQTEPAEAVFTLLIPAGSEVTAGGEIYKVARLGEGHLVNAVSLEVSSSLAASGLTFDVGTSATADCFMDGEALGNGAGGVSTKIAGLVGTNAADNASDGFADGFVGASTSILDLQFSIIGTAGTPVTAGDRTVTLRVKYSRALPEQIVTGVSDPTYPLAGSKVVKPATVFTYNGNAP